MIKINIYYFIVGLCIGFFLIYISAPVPDVIIKNPNLENAGKITYIDNSNVCYRYYPKQVKCPKNDNNVINDDDETN
jgi:hypothetical protein